MHAELLEKLLHARDRILGREGDQYTYRLVTFDQSSMEKDAILGTPFRRFESVPFGRPSRRKQNDQMGFDPYQDTLFDYPLVVKDLLASQEDALAKFNWHLTVQVPYCGMDCWHCYNPKRICAPGLKKITTSAECWTAKRILDSFAECRRSAIRENREYKVLRVSGGEPFLVPELIAELLNLISDERNPDYPDAVWTETNLTTWAPDSQGRSVFEIACNEALANNSLDVKDALIQHWDKLVVHPCFHGLTDANIKECTGTDGIAFSDLVEGFGHLAAFCKPNKLHLYPTFITEASDPQGIEALFEGLRKIGPEYPLKLALISVDFYDPVVDRIQEPERKDAFRCYSRYASLKRWNYLLRENYGVAYGQVLRPMAEIVASQYPSLIPTPKKRKEVAPYQPMLLLLKSVYRREYRQELLTILGASPNSEFVTAYDNKHVEPSLLGCLRAGFKPLGLIGQDVLLVYANPDATEKEVTYLPLRMGKLVEVHFTEQIIQFRITLGAYVSPCCQTEAKKAIVAYKNRMLEYFGVTNLFSSVATRWVLLGEKAILDGWNTSPEFQRLGLDSNNCPDEKDLRQGWDEIVNFIKAEPSLTRLREKSIFLQVLTAGKMSLSSESPLSMDFEEGNIAKFSVRYYIPDFAFYDRSDQELDTRTIVVLSTCDSMIVQGYEPRPLAKYGEFGFEVVCNELAHDISAQVVIESKRQSYYCPRIQLEFLLKKVGASERSRR